MAQKYVTHEVAKYLKNNGFPQATEYWYSQDGGICYSLSDLAEIGYISRPSYLDAWLWLWRIKNIKIEHIYNFATYIYGFEEEIQLEGHSDPEDAINAGINYLVSNDLISNKK